MLNMLKRYPLDRLYIGYVNVPTNKIKAEVALGVSVIKQVCQPSILYKLDENWYEDLDGGYTCLDQSKAPSDDSFVTVEVLKPLKYYCDVKKKELFKFEVLKKGRDNYRKYNHESWDNVSFKESRIAWLRN